MAKDTQADVTLVTGAVQRPDQAPGLHTRLLGGARHSFFIHLKQANDQRKLTYVSYRLVFAMANGGEWG